MLALVVGLLVGGVFAGGSDDEAGPAPEVPGSTGPSSTPDVEATDAPSEQPSSPVADPTEAFPSQAATPTQTAPTPSAPSRIALSALSGARVSSPVTVTSPDDVESVRWLLDGTFLEKDDSGAPFEVTLTPSVGKHTLEARVKTSSGRRDTEVEFTVTGAAPAASGGSSKVTPPGGPAALPALPAPKRTVRVATADALRTAIADAQPGDRIELADGTYTGDPQFEATAQGTKAAPIVLTGSRRAVLTTGETEGGGYGLHVQGSYWRLVGFTVRDAKKGVVFDGSVGSVVERLDVGTIGQEAVHFRSGSSHGAVVDSDIHDTGLRSPQFGEGVYVGSAHKNWPDGGPDKSDAVLVQGNFIYNTTAEGIDVKEGTTGGVIRGNRFDKAGISGENSADSWVDIKGNGWLIEGNTGSGTLLDAFQTHVESNGWGERNIFSKNTVTGGVPGYAVMIVKGKANGNIVRCDNNAKGAAKGLSNVTCTR